MNKMSALSVSTVVFLFAISLGVAQASTTTKEEMSKLLSDSTKANKEVTAYREQFLTSPKIVALKKEVEDSNKSLKTKVKEFEGLWDAKYNKNSEVVALLAKTKEAYAIDSELTRVRNGMENEQEIKNMKKEAADLRTKAFAIEQKTRKLVESKFSSDEKVKELQAKKASLSSASTKLFELRKNAMNSSDVIALQAEIFKLKNDLSTKTNEFRKSTDSVLKTLNSDEKFKALEQNAKDLSLKVKNSRKVLPIIPTQKAK